MCVCVCLCMCHCVCMFHFHMREESKPQLKKTSSFDHYFNL